MFSLLGKGTARTTPAERAQQDRLLSGVLQIFSLIANADGSIHEDEVHYVEEFLASLHPEDTRRLVEEFTRDVAQNLPLEPTVAALKDEFSYEEKLFVLGKSYELLDGHGIAEAELLAARAIASGLGIEAADAALVEQHLLHNGEGGKKNPVPSAHVHVLRLSDQTMAPDEVSLPLPGLRVEIYALAGGFYIRQTDEKVAIMVGSHRLRRNFLTKIRRLDAVRIGGVILRQGDLPFYLHRAAKMDQPQTLYLSSDGRSIGASTKAPAQPAMLELYMEGVLMIASTPDSKKVKLNGEPLVKPKRILLGDALELDGMPLDARKLLFNHLPDEFTFSSRAGDCSISNKPDADIHIPDRQGKRWEARLSRVGEGDFRVDIGDCPHAFLRRGKPLPHNQTLRSGDRFLLAGFGLEIEGDTVRRHPPGVQSYAADKVSFVFADQSVGLDSVAFEAERGDLICVLGPSGCGKSTLLSILTGQFAPTSGAVRLDGADLQRNGQLMSRIGFVPQDDLLFENLTVGENLEFSARLRAPGAGPEKIEGMVRKAISEVGLRERRGVRAGGPLEKTLSGGERKRLNIGLELLGDYEILLLDEPTSGLSSGDAMKVTEVLKNRALDGGIIFVVAHQPSAKLLELFDKVLLLDKGGKVAFFGDIAAAFRYFHAHEEGEIAGAKGETIALDADFLFEALERSSLRIDGTPDQARRHPPVYWQQRFAKWRDANVLGRLSHHAPPEALEDQVDTAPRLSSRFKQFLTLLQRESLNKRRNVVNLLVSLGSAFGLALIVGAACRESVDGVYLLERNRAFGNFLFLTTVVAIFLALSASVTEIVKDRAIRMRERLLGIPHALYLLSKLLPLLVIFLAQVALYEAGSFWVLGLHELWAPYWLLLGVAGFCGIALGLFFSALPGMTDKAASALIPILLVPQIILSGADPFPFYRMAHLHWPLPRPATDREAGKNPPWSAQAMPSRWTYQALICLQRDEGFEAQYRRALKTLNEQRKAGRVLEDGDAKAEEKAAAQATIARLTPAILEQAQAIKDAGSKDGWGEFRRMTPFVNSVDPGVESNLSAPDPEVVLPNGQRLGRVAFNTSVLGAMGLVWLTLAWLLLRFGQAISKLFGRA